MSYFILNRHTAIKQAIEQTSPRWHDRAWVIQELGLAQTSYICCGRMRMKYTPSMVGRIFIESDMLTKTSQDVYFLSQRLMSYCHREGVSMFASQNRRALTGLMQDFGDFQASDDRDRIYSMLGLLLPHQAALIGSNYSIPCCEVYARATYAILMHHGNLLELQSVDLRARRCKGLSTWALDFGPDIQSRFGAPGIEDDVGLTRQYLKINTALDQSNKYLSFHAVSFDVVDETRSLVGLITARSQRLAAVMHATLKSSLEDRTTAADDMNHTESNDALEGRVFKQAIRSKSTSDLNSASLCIFDKTSSAGDLGIIYNAMSIWDRRTAYSNFSLPGQSKSYRATPENSLMLSLRRAVKYADAASGGTCTFVTSAGFIGLAPVTMQAGDLLVLAKGSRYFLILRNRGEYHDFCGYAFVNRTLDDELWDHWGPDVPQMRFVLC